ncbi:NADP-dependent oxidoreductase domain-containing protein [Talaromyces proteolyticus]|uniref:NADP-dependent oxidoreductase domain-containing protein n=1 Tax=Talaromyces proteolyticus TaxID=1131652 RepID=A0AAD4PVG4_9EURO|nr:NADP-dependent oxidoreductase domain-containing protein [Talaromyces proteolyticus]KAH8690668.1 NADP-dependent oxidoreductase domain-containing protein [Talaromyces proteolyticus]
MAELLPIPDIIYGTAFKFDNSAKLVEAALKAGFRGIDTAGSNTAYRENLVGDGIAAAIASGDLKREDLYIQTKFSPFKEGKDPALYPYDITAGIPEQVEQSVSSSLRNLRTSYIDCLILHSLYPNIEDSITAWRAMEGFVSAGTVRSLGLSNTDAESLRQIYESATVKPRVVQNRFTEDTAAAPNPKMPANLPYPQVAFDRDVREVCEGWGIVYTPWGLLWGNPSLLDDPELFEKIGREIGVSKQVACFASMLRLSKGCKIKILCGTTKEERMYETLDGLRRVGEFLAEGDAQRAAFDEAVERVERVIL